VGGTGLSRELKVPEHGLSPSQGLHNCWEKLTPFSDLPAMAEEDCTTHTASSAEGGAYMCTELGAWVVGASVGGSVEGRVGLAEGAGELGSNVGSNEGPAVGTKKNKASVSSWSNWMAALVSSMS
jgi:hypothetical protein